MTATAIDNRAGAAGEQADYRYGVVFLIVLALLVLEIAGPDVAWDRAVGIALAGGALTVAVATSGARGTGWRQGALGVGVATILIFVGAVTGLLSAAVVFAAATVIVAAIPATLAGGLLRLTREQGVRVQAVAGGLAIYLSVGLLFVAIIAFISHVQAGPYFVAGKNVSSGIRVYYSFTVLTTTGFGDYTAATPVGRAVAVFEMLSGQLYLVTVIGVLVGHYMRPQK